MRIGDARLHPLRAMFLVRAVERAVTGLVIGGVFVALHAGGATLAGPFGLAILTAVVGSAMELRRALPTGDLPEVPERARVEAPPRVGRDLLVTAGAMAGLTEAAVWAFGPEAAAVAVGFGLGCAVADGVAAARIAAWERRHACQLVGSESATRGDEDALLLRRPRSASPPDSRRRVLLAPRAERDAFGRRA